MDSREVETTALRKLMKSKYPEVKDIACQYDERARTLTLYGRVSCFYQKQIAQELVRDIECVERVVNTIEVTGR